MLKVCHLYKNHSIHLCSNFHKTLAFGVSVFHDPEHKKKSWKWKKTRKTWVKNLKNHVKQKNLVILESKKRVEITKKSHPICSNRFQTWRKHIYRNQGSCHSNTLDNYQDNYHWQLSNDNYQLIIIKT